MIVASPEALKGMLRADARLLGLDIGTKTVGLALSDTRRSIATPLETIRRGRFTDDAHRLLRLKAEHAVGALVVGLPVSLDGTEGPRCQSVRQFARNLQQLASPGEEPPILFWDERFSTAVVQRQMIEADVSRRRRAELVDKAAAAYILQGLLDRLHHIG